MAPIPPADPGILTNWLGRINDSVLLSQLSIPGTHNSSASYFSLPSVQCQGADVTTQLRNGVRFLDVRTARTFFGLCGGPEELQVIHGNFPVRIPFPVKLTDLLHDVYAFLEQNPSETVIVSIKQEGPANWEGDEFPNLIWKKYISPNQDRWYLRGDIPQLGAARGKAVLFRRFGVKNEELRNNFGFEASWWKYNTPNDDRGTFAVQDFGEVNDVEDFPKKTALVNDHLTRAVQYNSTQEAANPQSAKLFLNFCSGSNFFNPKCWPQNVSHNVNDGIQQLGPGCGVVIIDYAEYKNWELVRQIVNLNFSN